MRRRDLLRAGLVLPLVGLPARAATPKKRLIVVFCDGGWDPTLAFDPKPGVDGIDGPYVDLDPDDPLDTEEIGTWGDIDVTLNDRRRPGVTAFFEDWGHDSTIVRGLWMGSVSHWIGRSRALCGTEASGAPDLTTWVGLQAPDRPLGVVDLAGVGRFGAHADIAARAGARGQLRGLLLPGSRFPMPDGSPRPEGLAPTDRVAIDAWLADRAATDRRPGRMEAHEARARARARADRLTALGPDLEPLLPAGERNLQDQVDLTIELLASQTCQAVLVDSTRSWDTHANHATQHASFSATFYGLRALASGLEAVGLLDETLVVAVSEMGRTPLRNGEQGTDHWPYTGAVLFGAGLAGGRVVGATDARLVGAPVEGDLLRYDRFAASVLDIVGIDPAAALPSIRPVDALKG